ncbi:MAG TPA: hypothetical protein VKG23_00725 [Thermoanaerobaculia bacterium]|nr:hypothetical protein [Thermoanaerobaculia bacterium]
MNRNFGLRSTPAAIAALCVSTLVMADSDQQTTRPVIRGSGSNVTIEYQSKLQPKLSWSAPAPAVAPAETPAAEGPLDEAVRMKSAGASDQDVIAFLRKNQADMPDVVDADTIRDLRKAGAGDAVVALVSKFSAIDIGPTGEGSAVPPQAFEPQEADTSAFPDLANLGYPFYGGGGFGSGSGFWWGHRHFGPKFFPRKNVFFHFHVNKPFFPNARPLPAHFPQRMTMSRITGGPAGHSMSAGSGGGRRTR